LRVRNSSGLQELPHEAIEFLWMFELRKVACIVDHDETRSANVRMEVLARPLGRTRHLVIFPPKDQGWRVDAPHLFVGDPTEPVLSRGRQLGDRDEEVTGEYRVRMIPHKRRPALGRPTAAGRPPIPQIPSDRRSLLFPGVRQRIVQRLFRVCARRDAHRPPGR
jgi:hypothetical protein